MTDFYEYLHRVYGIYFGRRWVGFDYATKDGGYAVFYGIYFKQMEV